MIILDVFIIMVFSEMWVTSGFFIFQAVVRLNHRVTQQVMTETTKSWRVKGETHGIPHGSGHHGSRGY